LPLPIAAPVDLLSGRRGSKAGRWVADIDWRAWRLPGALAAATVTIALLGLNLHWAMLTQERDELRGAIERRYRQTFPDAQVVVDPVLQMERQVAGMRTRAGQSGPEDFVPLLTRFSQALGGQANDALSGVDYRDGRLRVRFQPGQFESRAVRDTLIQACQRLGLQLRFDAEREPTATVALLR
jgi:type II secretion system protein L